METLIYTVSEEKTLLFLPLRPCGMLNGPTHPRPNPGPVKVTLYMASLCTCKWDLNTGKLSWITWVD